MLAALDWSCLLLTNGFKELGNCIGTPFEKLVEAQSCLYTIIMASKSKKAVDKAHYKYAHIIYNVIFQKRNFTLYFSFLQVEASVETYSRHRRQVLDCPERC